MQIQYIALEREYASGGQEIGERVAKALGIPCYGREILEKTAAQYGMTAEYLEYLEENYTGSLLHSIYLMGQQMQSSLASSDAVTMAEAEVIRSLALDGPAVFVGRCAGEALAGRDNVLRVFIHASPDFRKERAARCYGIPADQVEHTLHSFDTRRRNFYRSTTGHKWSDPNNYHLMFNSSELGLDTCVSLLESAYRQLSGR